MKKSTGELFQLISSELATISYGEQPKELYDPVSYFMRLGGKRIRPMLTLLGYSLFKNDPEKIIRPALAMEVFHNFTLLHDDLMDQAPLRRGKAAVHEKWNPNIAILSGDVMFVRAYEMLLDCEPSKLKKVMQTFCKTASEVCEGQQWDMNFESVAEVTEQEYLKMIRLKTAVLLGCCLEVGGILADATEQNYSLLQEFGVNIGIGFQLKDDLLDVYADHEKFGKQVGGDIISNKKTFLLIKALELAQGKEKKELLNWLSKIDFHKEEKVISVTEIYNNLGIKELTESKIDLFFKQGFEALEHLQVHNEGKEYLIKFTQDLINREK